MKYKCAQHLDIFLETEDADMTEDTSRVKNYDQENLHNLIFEIIKENEEILDELEEEINAS